MLQRMTLYCRDLIPSAVEVNVQCMHHNALKTADNIFIARNSQ